VLAIHAAITAGDALTVRYLGVRSASQRHLDVIALIEKIPKEKRGEVTRQLRGLLSEKSEVEYDDQLLPVGRGEEMLKVAERVVERAAAGIR
jgi:hypothetical protein